MTFLYPYFLLFLALPFALLFLKHITKKNSVWASICDAHLLPFLTVQVNGQKSLFYKRLMIALWCLACFCMAGPAILKKDVPTAFVSNGIVVVLDMSPAMDKGATEQMTRKLYDLLPLQKDSSLGLVLVDEKAYVALPITQDKSIFQNIIPDLKERIMPSIGQNIEAGIKKAENLLEQSGFKNGQILVITAGVQNPSKLANSVQNSKYPIQVLGVGSNTEKHPVVLSDGQFWGGQNPILVELNSLPMVLGPQYRYASLDDSDLKSFLENSTADKIEQAQQSIEQYQNLGIYGVLLLLPLTALLFRRGVLWVLLLCFISLPSYAGFWWRTEQELYQKQMQGVAAFNVGQYEKAQEQFNLVAPYDVEALYNLGNAQAYAGKIQEAIATYERVLAKNPNHEDAAHNLEYLKKQLPPPPEQESSSSLQQEQNESNSDEQNNSSDNKASDNQEEESKKGAENTTEQKTDAAQEQQDTQDSNTNESKTQEQQATAVMQDISEEPKQQDKESSAMVPSQDQKQQEWLNQIEPDAGRVLRYRLFKQYREQQ